MERQHCRTTISVNPRIVQGQAFVIRFRRITMQPLNQWLPQVAIPVQHQQYRLRVWREAGDLLDPLRQEVIDYAREALDDAREKMRRGFADPLSPFEDDAHDPAANYPAVLHRFTLQGYLGETLAGLAIEHFGAFGHYDWHVPAFLFRMHSTEFEHLDEINQKVQSGVAHDADARAHIRPGRTGDDALAFRIGAAGQITHVLTLEAKCLTTHKAAIATDAHAKISSGVQRPTGVLELINLLADYSTTEAIEWRLRLLSFYRTGYLNAERWDGVAYAVGNRPVAANRIGWLPAPQPHAAYTGGRPLEAMEFQFTDVRSLVNMIYRGN
ncbi:hypothetical protein [Sphingopyxis panaciterrae]